MGDKIKLVRATQNQTTESETTQQPTESKAPSGGGGIKLVRANEVKKKETTTQTAPQETPQELPVEDGGRYTKVKTDLEGNVVPLSEGVSGAKLMEELGGSTSELEGTTSASTRAPQAPRIAAVDTDRIRRESRLYDQRKREEIEGYVPTDLQKDYQEYRQMFELRNYQPQQETFGQEPIEPQEPRPQPLSFEEFEKQQRKERESEFLKPETSSGKYLNDLKTLANKDVISKKDITQYSDLSEDDENEVRRIASIFEDKYFGSLEDISDFDRTSKRTMEEIENGLPEDWSEEKKKKVLYNVSVQIEDKYNERKAQLENTKKYYQIVDNMSANQKESLEKYKWVFSQEDVDEARREMAPGLDNDEFAQVLQVAKDREIEKEGYIEELKLQRRLGQEDYQKAMDAAAEEFYTEVEKSEKVIMKDLTKLYREGGDEKEIAKLEDLLTELRGKKFEKIHDPVTGEKIDYKGADQSIIEWNKDLNQEAIEFSNKNSLSDLKQLQSRYFAELSYLERKLREGTSIPQGLKGDSDGEKIADALIKQIASDKELENMSSEVSQARKKFLAVSKAIDLNKSVKDVDRAWYKRLGESLVEGFGIDLNTEEDYVRDYINALTGKGGYLSDEEMDRAEQRFGDKVAETIGGSIPVMLSIMATTAFTEGTGTAAAIEKGFANLAAKYTGKGKKFVNGMSKLMSGAFNREIQFRLAGQEGGAGEGIGATAYELTGLDALLSRSSIGKLVNGVLKQTSRATGETIEEYAGQLHAELSKNKEWAEAFGDVVGEDPMEKLAITYITGAVFAFGKAGKDFKISETYAKMKEKLKNYKGSSAVVNEAKKMAEAQEKTEAKQQEGQLKLFEDETKEAAPEEKVAETPTEGEQKVTEPTTQTVGEGQLEIDFEQKTKEDGKEEEVKQAETKEEGVLDEEIKKLFEVEQKAPVSKEQVGVSIHGTSDGFNEFTKSDLVPEAPDIREGRTYGYKFADGTTGEARLDEEGFFVDDTGDNNIITFTNRNKSDDVGRRGYYGTTVSVPKSVDLNEAKRIIAENVNAQQKSKVGEITKEEHSAMANKIQEEISALSDTKMSEDQFAKLMAKLDEETEKGKKEAPKEVARETKVDLDIKEEDTPLVKAEKTSELEKSNRKRIYLPTPWKGEFNAKEGSTVPGERSAYEIILDEGSETEGHLIVHDNQGMEEILSNSSERFIDGISKKSNTESEGTRIDNIEAGRVKKVGDKWVVTKEGEVAFGKSKGTKKAELIEGLKTKEEAPEKTIKEEVVESLKSDLEEATPEAKEQIEKQIEEVEKEIEAEKSVSPEKKSETPIESKGEGNLKDAIKQAPAGAATMANAKIFESTKEVVQDVANETGLTGDALIKEAGTRIEKMTDGEITAEDVLDVKEEVIPEVVAPKQVKKVKVEDVPQDRLTKAAEFLRSKKFGDSFNDMSRLSSTPVDIVFKKAVDTSLEAAAVALETTSKISSAVDAGIVKLRESEWYKQLSDNGRKTAEKVFESNFKQQVNSQAKTFTPEVTKEAKKKVSKPVTPKAETKVEEKVEEEVEEVIDPKAKAKEIRTKFDKVDAIIAKNRVATKEELMEANKLLDEIKKDFNKNESKFDWKDIADIKSKLTSREMAVMTYKGAKEGPKVKTTEEGPKKAERPKVDRKKTIGKKPLQYIQGQPYKSTLLTDALNAKQENGENLTVSTFDANGNRVSLKKYGEGDPRGYGEYVNASGRKVITKDKAEFDSKKKLLQNKADNYNDGKIVTTTEGVTDAELQERFEATQPKQEAPKQEAPKAKSEPEKKKEEPKAEPEKKEGPVAKTLMDRFIKSGDLTEEEAIKMAELSRKAPETDKGRMAVINEMEESIGLDRAYELTNNNDTKNNFRKETRNYFAVAKAQDLKKKAAKTTDPAERTKLLDQAARIMAKIALDAEKAGQASQFFDVIYDGFPEMRPAHNVADTVRKNIASSLESQSGRGDMTVGEEIETIRGEIEKEIRAEIEKEVTKLKDEINKLKEQAGKQNKKAKGKKQISDALAEIKKLRGRKGPGGVAGASIIPGVSAEMMNAIGKLISGYVNVGLGSTAQIVSQVVKDLKGLGVKVKNSDIEKVAMSNGEFAIKKVNEVLGKEAEVTTEGIVENSNALWGKYEQKIADSVKRKVENKAKTKKEATNLSKIADDITNSIKEKIDKARGEAKQAAKKGKKSAKETLKSLIENEAELKKVYDGAIKQIAETDPELAKEVEAEVANSGMVSNALVDSYVKQSMKASDVDAALEANQTPEQVAKELATELGVNVTPELEAQIAASVDQVMEARVEAKEARKKERMAKEGLTDKDVREALEDYYINGKATKASLAEHLAEKLGITPKQAQAILGPANLEAEVEARVKEVAKKELDKNLKPSEDLTLEEKEARKKEMAENRKIVNKVTKSVMLGELSGTDFKNAFAEKYGFPEVSADQMALLEQLVNDAKRFEESGQRELHQKTQRLINTELRKMRGKDAAFYANLIMELAYTNALSGINTQGNANLGALSTSGIHFLGKAIGQVLKLRGGATMYGLRAMGKSLRAASASAKDARRFNYSRFTNHNAYMEGATEQEMGIVEEQVIKGVSSYLRKVKSADSLSEAGKNLVKAIGVAVAQHARMNFLLNASDAFLTTSFSEFNNAVEEYNRATKNAGFKGAITNIVNRKDLINRLDKAMGYDSKEKFAREVDQEIAEEKARIDKEVDEMDLDPREAKAEKKRRRNMTISKGYKARRIQEKVTQERDQEIHEEAVKTARDWIMLSDPDGITGYLNEKLKMGMKIDPGKEGWKNAAAVILGTTIMFSRMTAKTINAIATSTPVIGLVPTFVGLSKDAEGKWKVRNKYKADKLLFQRRIMANLLMTAAGGALFNHMFMWNDDEDEWQLDPNRLIDITSGVKRNEQALKDGPWGVSIAFRSSPDEEFGSYRTLKYAPQTLGIAAILGNYSDRTKGLGTDKQLKQFKERKEDKGKWAPLDVKLGASLMVNQFLEGSFNSIGKISKSIQMSNEENVGEKMGYAMLDHATSSIKNITQPNFYRDLINESGGRGDSKKQYPKDWLGKLKYDYFGLDANAENKTDMFGNEYKTQSKFSQWIDGTMNDNYNNPEWKILLKYPDVDVPVFKPREKIGRKGKNYNIEDEEVLKEYHNIQKSKLKTLITEDYDELNQLEKAKLQSKLTKKYNKSIDLAKKEIIKKYKGTEKIERLK